MKGMTPIAKNIFVVDEQGNQYEATYPRRAQGLVKSGRARFLDANTICLACPPINVLEDNSMSEVTNKIDDINKPLELTMSYVLNRIDYIMKESSHINNAIETIRYMEINEGPMGSDSARGEAISHAVKSRETTNQQLIKLLEKMYDDLKPEKPSVKDKTLTLLERVLNNPSIGDDMKTALVESLDTVRHLND
jgi:hypothetical protein